ncbi:MAG: hypothetical protein Athens101428_25 [Candidatus Berkelbacteria bacterium Athens1014_28]|uniref:Uncharacterized protein n=1 Tax=Candidatus Berkelbacteria bacterium Athens1014_28 TaxID=2017145 RepID=A0A554LR06_9BACT|nr:MAG: hypothetical protein Athens101428_25 [Candidatus Berkelbacteria bacterium Athens1014_28]
MTKKRANLITNADNELIEVNSFLHTDEEHKDWYKPNVMGKQLGKPKYDLRETKK